MRIALAACWLALTAAALLAGAAPAPDPAGRPQTACPVTGEPISKGAHLDFQGQRVYFCSAKCPAEFRKDPEKYFARFAKDGIELENVQTTCPVSGEKLGEGDMGEPVSIQYRGRTVQFCCRMCVKKFHADPARYLAQLPGEQPAAK